MLRLVPQHRGHVQIRNPHNEKPEALPALARVPRLGGGSDLLAVSGIEHSAG